MKAAIILLLVGLAVAQRPGGGFGGGGPSGGFGGGPSGGVGGNSHRFGGRSTPGFRSGPSGAGPFNPCAHIERFYGRFRRDWGPKAWGIGLNNPCAIPPNPIEMERALKLANKVPGTLVHVDRDGDVELTNQLGREAKVIDVWGRDLTDGLDSPFFNF